MENSPVRIDLKTGRPLRTTPLLMRGRESTPLCQQYSMFELGNCSEHLGIFSTSSKVDEVPRLKMFSSDRVGEQIKTVGTGDSEKRFPHHPPLAAISKTPRATPFSNINAIEVAGTPTHFQVPRVDSCLVRQKPIDKGPLHTNMVTNHPPVPPFKIPQTPSQADSEQIRRNFVHGPAKQHQADQVQKKTVAEELKRTTQPSHVRRDAPALPLSQSKQYLPRPRSATFIIDKKAGVGNVSGDHQKVQKPPMPSKSVSSNVRLPKIEERPAIVVNLNKAARLRLERFKKGSL